MIKDRIFILYNSFTRKRQDRQETDGTGNSSNKIKFYMWQIYTELDKIAIMGENLIHVTLVTIAINIQHTLNHVSERLRQ